MRRFLGLAGVLAILILGQSCTLSGDSITTPSGIKVKFVKKGDGEFPEFDDVLYFHLMYKDHRGKVVYTTDGLRGPYKIRNVNLLKETDGILGEVLRYCKVGDSITFQVPYKRFYKARFNQECPKELEKEMATYYASLFRAVTMDEIMDAKRNTYDSARYVNLRADEIHSVYQKKADSTLLNNYFVENDIKSLNRTEGGAYFKINKSGTGKEAKKGSTVTVQYKGSLLNGTEFYSSYKDPYALSFVLGFGEEVEGWNETILGMKEGTETTLYIPSTLGYGNHQSGPIVVPNSILVYEVEIVKVK